MAQAEEPARSGTAADGVRRRLDEVFGDVLPEVTRDETPDTADDRAAAGADEWLRANRPPHHERG
jgi:hypothetical protein